MLQLDFADPMAAERLVALRFVGTSQHPCAVCRDQARAGSREPGQVQAGTVRRTVEGLAVLVCQEHERSEL